MRPWYPERMDTCEARNCTQVATAELLLQYDDPDQTIHRQPLCATHFRERAEIADGIAPAVAAIRDMVS